MKYFKVLLLCIAVPIIVAFFLCIILPILVIFILLCAIFAPTRLKGTFQQVRTFRKSPPSSGQAETDNIDVECTVLESKEISKDS